MSKAIPIEEERAARLESDAKYAALKSAYDKDTARLAADRDKRKVVGMTWFANKGTQHD